MISPGSAPVRAVDAYGHDRSVFVMRQERGREYCSGHPPVAHEHLVVAFCTGGTAVIEQQGRWSLAEGDVVLIPAGAPHRRFTTSRRPFIAPRRTSPRSFAARPGARSRPGSSRAGSPRRGGGSATPMR
jgi:hypothetical protein